MRFFSIDLGESRTKVAKAERDGRPAIVPNTLGELATPSVVYFPENGEPVVGSEALNMAFVEPHRVVRGWKRAMGTQDVLYRDDQGNTFMAKDIASILLSYVKRSVEERTGEIVTDAVITVPANYTETQKAETIEAAERNGIKALYLPTEPVAAALGNDVHLRGDGVTLVFDLGGGTFDVSLVRVAGNLIEVIRTMGDPRLGGQDVNERIRQQALRMFREQHGYAPEGRQDGVFHADLESRVEQVKTTLTVRESANLIIRDGDHLINVKITRQELESWIGDFKDRAVKLVEEVLATANVRWEDITTILPVGGGSRMPIFPQTLKQLSGKNLSQNVEPDYAAALGGIVAGRIELQRQNRPAETEAGALPPINFFAREVTSHSLGVSALNGGGEPVQHVVLPSGTPYPSVQVQKFTLVEPNQTHANIIILEGENGKRQDDCDRLGEFHLENLSPYPDLTERVEVAFSLDASGLLTASARDLKSGVTAQMVVTYKAQPATDVPS